MSRYPNETLVTSPDSEGHQYWANFDARPLGKGRRKKAYKGLLQGLGPRKNQKVVVKVFRAHEGKESDCDTEISRHLVVRNIAVHFNRFLHDRSTTSTASSSTATNTTNTASSIITTGDIPGAVSTATSSATESNSSGENTTSNIPKDVPRGVCVNAVSQSVDVVSSPNVAWRFSSQFSVESAGSVGSGSLNSESSGDENLGKVSTEVVLSGSLEKELITSPTSPLSPEVEASSPRDRNDIFSLPAKVDKTTEIVVDIIGLENNQEDKIFEEVTSLMIPEIIPEEKKQDLADLKSQEARNVSQVIRIIVPAKVTLEIICMASCLPRGKRKLNEDEWVLLESYLGQSFCNFRNSEGLAVRQGRRKSSLPLISKRTHTVLDAFIHYSYHWSQGSFVVSGLQGVEDSKGYRLTAPVVHSVSGSFGDTDQGCEGIKAVMETHVCCSLCQALARPGAAGT